MGEREARCGGCGAATPTAERARVCDLCVHCVCVCAARPVDCAVLSVNDPEDKHAHCSGHTRGAPQQRTSSFDMATPLLQRRA